MAEKERARQAEKERAKQAAAKKKHGSQPKSSKAKAAAPTSEEDGSDSQEGDDGEAGAAAASGADASNQKRKERQASSQAAQQQQQQSLSSTSGAAKRRRKREEAKAAANPPDLRDLVLVLLPGYVRRKQFSFYRSTLRSQVRSIDKVKPQRTFGDKDEWKKLLSSLQQEGMLSYSELTDNITLSQPASPTELRDAIETTAKRLAGYGVRNGCGECSTAELLEQLSQLDGRFLALTFEELDEALQEYSLDNSCFMYDANAHTLHVI